MDLVSVSMEFRLDWRVTQFLLEAAVPFRGVFANKYQSLSWLAMPIRFQSERSGYLFEDGDRGGTDGLLLSA